MIITVTDFAELLPFSNKIEASQMAAFITQARQFDLLPLLGHETLETLDALVMPALLAPPAAGVLAVLGARYVRRERVYRALAATLTAVPVLAPAAAYPVGTPGAAGNPAPEGAWQYERALTLWSQFVRPYWVQRAFSRFLTTHGLNISKAGITVPIDRQQGTYERPSAGQIATLQAAVDTPAEVLLARLTRFLRAEGLLWLPGLATGAGHYYGADNADASHCGPAAATRHRRPIRGINR